MMDTVCEDLHDLQHRYIRISNYLSSSLDDRKVNTSEISMFNNFHHMVAELQLFNNRMSSILKLIRRKSQDFGVDLVN